MRQCCLEALQDLGFVVKERDEARAKLAKAEVFIAALMSGGDVSDTDVAAYEAWALAEIDDAGNGEKG